MAILIGRPEKGRMARSSQMVRRQILAAVESSSSGDGADAIDGLHGADEKVMCARKKSFVHTIVSFWLAARMKILFHLSIFG